MSIDAYRRMGASGLKGMAARVSWQRSVGELMSKRWMDAIASGGPADRGDGVLRHHGELDLLRRRAAPDVADPGGVRPPGPRSDDHAGGRWHRPERRVDHGSHQRRVHHPAHGLRGAGAGSDPGRRRHRAAVRAAQRPADLLREDAAVHHHTGHPAAVPRHRTVVGQQLHRPDRWRLRREHHLDDPPATVGCSGSRWPSGCSWCWPS